MRGADGEGFERELLVLAELHDRPETAPLEEPPGPAGHDELPCFHDAQRRQIEMVAMHVRDQDRVDLSADRCGWGRHPAQVRNTGPQQRVREQPHTPCFDEDGAMSDPGDAQRVSF
jgi:hypothetical protein